METAGELERVRAAAEPVLWALAGADKSDQDQIPDLLGDTTKRVLKRLRDGAEIDDLELYAKRVARNLFTDWLRSKRRDRLRHAPRGRESETPLVDRLVNGASMTPSSLAVELDEQRRHAPVIEEALASLSRRELDVLRLRFAEGHSSAEVAELLGYSSPAVVDVTVSRARKKLEKRLPLSLMSILLGG